MTSTFIRHLRFRKWNLDKGGCHLFGSHLFGSRLRTRSRTITVESTEKKYGQWTVYNLEVNAAHRYYVTEKLILVHNNNGIFDNPLENLGDMSREELLNEAEKIADCLGEQSNFMGLEEFKYYHERLTEIRNMLNPSNN